MKEFPKNSVMIEAILKEHSEEDMNNALRQHLKICGDNIECKERIDTLLNTKILTRRQDRSSQLRLPLISVCRMLKVKIPYFYIHYPDRRSPEQVERDRKDKEAQYRARPPKINYEEEISKIREKYQMYIHNLCKGDKNCIKRNKVEEFHEIINLYLARISEPHKPTDEDGGLPPYVVWSLAELNRELIYVRKLPDEIRCDYDSLIGGYFKRHLRGESLDYQAIASDIFRLHGNMVEGYESYAY